jgi:muramidase (phage lysozyme)
MLFASYAQHPNILQPFTQTDGKTNYTSAAGAYQFLWATWRRLQLKLKLRDFSPSNQDIAAMELISEAGAMPAVKSGDLFTALDLCAPTWASLPASTYKQPKRSVAFALAAFVESGGSLA